MANFKKILLSFFCFLTLTVSASPVWNTFTDNTPTTNTVQTQTMNIRITINSNSYIHLKDAPTSGHLEVYTILGQRIKRIDLKECKEGVSIDLSSGLYIIRAGRVAQKIIVK